MENTIKDCVEVFKREKLNYSIDGDTISIDAGGEYLGCIFYALIDTGVLDMDDISSKRKLKEGHYSIGLKEGLILDFVNVGDSAKDIQEWKEKL